MEFTRVSIQSANSGASLPDGHLVAGFLKEPDLVLCPRLNPASIEGEAPFRAYMFDVVKADPPADPPTEGEVVGLEGISCVCEEVVIVGNIGYAFFRLAHHPSEPGPLPVGELLKDLSDMSQDELWEDPRGDLNVPVPPHVKFDLAEQVVMTLVDEGDDGFSLCRWLRC
jgi:hypothetical protein